MVAADVLVTCLDDYCCCLGWWRFMSTYGDSTPTVVTLYGCLMEFRRNRCATVRTLERLVL